MNHHKNTIIKMIIMLVAIIIIFGSLSKLIRGHSKTLAEYARENPDLAYKESIMDETSVQQTNTSGNNDSLEKEENSNETKPAPFESSDSGSSSQEKTSASTEKDPEDKPPALIGSTLNGNVMEEERVTYQEGFYYEPLSDNLRRYITGVTFPEEEVKEITYENLRYVHVFHLDFEGKSIEGELICNEKIAQDLLEIFYELYLNEYQIEKIRLIDEYDGDDLASMEDNNTSCFNYRVVEGTTSLSKHALGLAIDINPLYNPYITYLKNGEEKVSPASAQPYADRKNSFPYKIDDTDLCYRLFKEHGFTWGGNWNSSKDYQHFQKTK